MFQQAQKVLVSTLVAVSSIAFIAGCGKDEVGGRIADSVDKEVAKTQMRGVWTAGCQDTNALAVLFDLPKMREEIDYGDSVQKSTLFYSDANCATADIRVTENGDRELASEVRDNVYQLNQKFNSVSITALTEAGKTKLNDIIACNRKDWTVNNAVDVTPDTSAGNRCWTKTPREIFDIIEISNGQLRYGLADLTKDKSTAEKRPDTLATDASVTYRRR